MIHLSEKIEVQNCDNKFVKLCRTIMWQIKINHKSVLCNPSTNSELEEIYERNYMLTFAYLMGGKTGSTKSTYNLLSNKLINGEVNKYICLNPDDDAYESRNLLKPGREYFCPDFLIHTSHDNPGENYEGQYMIMEAKTTSKLKQEDFNWDLFKLNLYVEELDFDTAIYLIVNTSFKDIATMITNYNYWHSEKLDPKKQNPQRNNTPHIYFLIQEDVEKQPEIYELFVSERKQ